MEFGAFLDQEFSELRQRLAEAASDAADAAVQRANASFQQTFEKLRTDQTQIAGDNERLTAENAALTWERNALVEEKNALLGEKNRLDEEMSRLLEEQIHLVEDARLNHRGQLLDRLVDVVDRIDHAGSISDVLVAVARGFHGDFQRVAIFEVRDGQLVPVAEQGFAPGSGVAQHVTPLETDAFLAHAARVRSARVIGSDTRAALGTQPFGDEPTVMVTLPVSMRGEILALIYADDAGAAGRPGVADAALKLAHVLQRHATLRIERLTIELKAVAELTAYAQMLVDEVEYMYEADQSAQKPADQRLMRLQDNLRCARQIFQQRVTVEGPAAESVLEDIVAAAIARKTGTPFGDDLTRVAAHRADAPHEAHV